MRYDMGDARAVVQMRSDDKGKKKNKKAPEAEAAPVPGKAMEAPGEAMASLGSAYLGRFVATLQSAGGNTAVQTELSGLNEGHGAAVKAKADVIAFKAMTDGQKVAKLAEKNGGQLPQSKGKEPPPEGAAPKGMEDPGAVVGFHQQRSGQLAQLASAYQAMQARTAQLAGMAGSTPSRRRPSPRRRPTSPRSARSTWACPAPTPRSARTSRPTSTRRWRPLRSPPGRCTRSVWRSSRSSRRR